VNFPHARTLLPCLLMYRYTGCLHACVNKNTRTCYVFNYIYTITVCMYDIYTPVEICLHSKYIYLCIYCAPGKGLQTSHPPESPCREAYKHWCCNPNGYCAVTSAACLFAQKKGCVALATGVCVARIAMHLFTHECNSLCAARTQKQAHMSKLPYR
jgi:hypothetical protein